MVLLLDEEGADGFRIRASRRQGAGTEAFETAEIGNLPRSQRGQALEARSTLRRVDLDK